MAHHTYLVANALPSSLHNPPIRWVVHNLRLEVAEGLHPNSSRTCTYSLLKAQNLSSCSQGAHKRPLAPGCSQMSSTAPALRTVNGALFIHVMYLLGNHCARLRSRPLFSCKHTHFLVHT